MKLQALLRLSLLPLFCQLVLPAFAQTAKAGGPPTWVELGENGAILARQVLVPVTGLAPTCPSVQVSGATAVPMKPRGTPPSGFGAVVVCEAAIPSSATSASIDGIQLPLPKKTISRIVLLGDTGCKGDATGTGKKVTPIEEPGEEEEAEEAAAAAPDDSPAAKSKHKSKKKKKEKQDCSKKSDWPFSTIAKNAAAQKPDLVIHVGDYVYVQGETWENWYAQFFQPAHDLLLAAPWIFVRGNHEICDSKYHGDGFFYLLDPRTNASCPSSDANSTSPYLVNQGGVQFVAMDSSGALCDFPPDGAPCTQTEFDTELKTWTTLFKQAKQLVSPGTAFLLTHRPLWGIKSPKSSSSPSTCPATKGTLVAINSTLQAAYQAASMNGIKMVLSGHIHNFQLITYKNQSGGVNPQPQLVVGDSGVEMSTPPPPEFKDCTLPSQTGSLSLSTFRGMQEFGFGVLAGDASRFDLYLKKGEHALKCDITTNSASCKTEALTVKPAKKKK